MILRALEAGKHVYTEKPLATTLEDADKIIATADRVGRKVGSAPVLMVHPETQYLRQLITSGAIGKVCFVRARGSNPGPAWCEDFLTDPTWFYKPGGGGPLFDLAVYPLTVITGLLGPAQRVVAMSGISVPDRTVRSGVMKGQQIQVEVDDNTQLILDFGDATFATIDATFCVLSARGPRTEIYGSGGVVNLYSQPNEPQMEIYRDEPGADLRGWLVPQPPYRGSLKPGDPRPDQARRPWSFADGVLHLAQCIEDGSVPIISAQHARHVLEITLKALDSARAGQVIALTTQF
jgi:predicted dehydrogenase